MPMKTCPRCGGDTGEAGARCPHCGSVLVRAAPGIPVRRRYRRRGTLVGLAALPAFLFFGYLWVRKWWVRLGKIGDSPYVAPETEETGPGPVKYIKSETERGGLRQQAREIADFIGWEKEAANYVRVVIPADGNVHVMLSVDGIGSWRRDPAPLRNHFARVAAHVYGKVFAQDRARKVLLVDNRDVEVCAEASWKDGRVELSP